MYKIKIYEDKEGHSSYERWFKKLSPVIKERVTKRLIRVRLGNLGDYKKIQGVKGLLEFRFSFLVRLIGCILLLGARI